MRFDQLEIDGASAMTPEELLKAVKKAAEERGAHVAKVREEAQGQNYDFKYGDTIVTGDWIDQVWGTLYSYEVVIGTPVVQLVNGPNGPQTVVTIPVSINFYKLVYYGPDGKPLPGGPQVQSVPGGSISINLTGAANGTDPCPAIAQALQSGFNITQAVQAIPTFLAQSWVDEVVGPDGKWENNPGVGTTITMRLGAHDGVKVGDKYDIYETDEQGNKIVVGQAIVTKVAPGLVANGSGTSKADVSRTELKVTSLDPKFNPQNLHGSQLEQHSAKCAKRGRPGGCAARVPFDRRQFMLGLVPCCRGGGACLCGQLTLNIALGLKA